MDPIAGRTDLLQDGAALGEVRKDGGDGVLGETEDGDPEVAVVVVVNV